MKAHGGVPVIVSPMERRGFDEQGKVDFDYRPVHMYTLTDEVDVVPLKKRTY